VASELARSLLESLTDDDRERLAPALEAELAAGMAAARRQWPALPADEPAFAEYVLERARAQAELAAALPRLRIADLLLAWWTTTNDSRALAAFDATHADALDRLLRRFHRLDPDELRQVLSIKLFVGSATAAPRILDYSGFGFLENWFKIIAARTFLDLVRSRDRERIDDSDDALFELPSPSDDPRDAAARAQVVAAVKRSLEKAIATLPARERTFLRHVTVDGLRLEQIAATYQLHRVTVARTLASARRQLHDAMRALVVEELGVAAPGLASMLQLLDSQIDLSLQRLFPEPTL
jgi:RNA polymerase sigma-70 factor